MNQYSDREMAMLIERVGNLTETLHDYIEQDRQRHADLEAALTTHIATTLPIINDFFKLRGEMGVLQKAMWLMAGSLLATIGTLVVNYVGKH